jgi:flavin reductase (DIM6/NTAB) family NADH-FMN oxidoreductase RutF
MKKKLVEIMEWDERYRLRLINSISGYKGAHLIGTKTELGSSNLAIFNSIVHIGSSPPLIGFIIRPLSAERHTYNNIIETGYYTLNHVHKSFLKKAHYTSTNFPKDVSEFEGCNLIPEFSNSFFAPYVNESNIKLGLKLIEDNEVKSNGSRLIIGEVQEIIIKEDYLEENGQIDLEKANDVCVTGLNQYSSVNKFKDMPYARLSELPNFKQKERPDNVVFDEETQTYNANVLPYGTNIGAPSIQPSGLSTWSNTSVNSFNHSFKNKMDLIKKEYQLLIDEYKVNDMLYKTNMTFEPIIGEEYHLYFSEKKGENFLSLIPPSSWKMKHIGSFVLNNDKTWREVKIEY